MSNMGKIYYGIAPATEKGITYHVRVPFLRSPPVFYGINLASAFVREKESGRHGEEDPSRETRMER